MADSDVALEAADYFRDLQMRICRAFESLEESGQFTVRPWSRPQGHRLQGGGTMRLMRGRIFEKVGVNVSHVWGELAPQFRAQIPGADDAGGRFQACGISLVAHMYNPHVPAVHMNLRYLSTSRAWFGGGSDLTPTFPDPADTAAFHDALRGACDTYRSDAYSEFKEACDRYFYLPHRKEARGVGGIFFDQLASGDASRDFAFARAVGEAFLGVYPLIVARRKDMPFNDAQREQLLVKRGRYVEFNLVYDKGTQFGFGTDADPEAYLMSLPPLVRW